MFLNELDLLAENKETEAKINERILYRNSRQIYKKLVKDVKI